MAGFPASIARDRRHRPVPAAPTRHGWTSRPPKEAERNFEIIEKLTPLTEERNLTLAQFALAWLLKNQVVISVTCGSRLTEHLDQNIAVDGVDLDAEAMTAVDEICPPPKIHGEWW